MCDNYPTKVETGTVLVPVGTRVVLVYPTSSSTRGFFALYDPSVFGLQVRRKEMSGFEDW